MKIPFFFFIVTLFFSCSTNIKYYHGYIYNTEKQPLANIKVLENDGQQAVTFTDSLGYFKILENNNFGGNLIISLANGKTIDTIRTVYTQSGEHLRFQFINGRKDTLFINTDKIDL